MTKRHKHADVIIAWASGEAIQIKTAEGAWIDYPKPTFSPDYEYRIKPEPKQLWVRPYKSPDTSPYVIGVVRAAAQNADNFNSTVFNWVGPAVLVWEEKV